MSGRSGALAVPGACARHGERGDKPLIDLFLLSVVFLFLAGCALALQRLAQPAGLPGVTEPQKTPVLGGHEPGTHAWQRYHVRFYSMTLLFIAFAQVTTNVLNNVVPPTYVLMDTFKLKYRTASVVVGLLAFATFPWELVKDESAAGLQLFVQTYSAFLGPIFAVLVVDYYLIRRRTLDVDKLYDEIGPYRGVNYAAVIASLVGAAVALNVSSISWYASLLPAGLTYLLLMRYWAPCQRFCQ